MSLCWLVAGHFSAQDASAFHSGSELHNFGKITIFGDLQTEGNIHSELNSEIVFMGSYWQNLATATNEGFGNLTFLQPNPNTGSSFSQNLEGGGENSPFTNIEIDNPENVVLFGTNTQITNTLRFSRGHLILNGNNLIIGKYLPGEITNYSKNRFIVTDGEAFDNTGFLVRKMVGGLPLAFPIGSAVGDYSPARITNTGGLNDFSIRVFPDVYEQGNTGTILAEKTIQRTWHITEYDPDSTKVVLTLQYDQSTEGNLFTPEESFVARYIGISPNLDGGALSLLGLQAWDFVGKINCESVEEGNITTNDSSPGSSMMSRGNFLNFTDYNYYTIHSCKIEDEFLIPNMFTPNGDGFNDTWEIDNIQLFEVRSVRIINRWGDIVFKANEYNNDWAGIFGHKNLPAGTYYYILDLGEEGIRKGDVTIIRE